MNVNFLQIVLLSIVFLFTSCAEDDVPTPEVIQNDTLNDDQPKVKAEDTLVKYVGVGEAVALAFINNSQTFFSYKISEDGSLNEVPYLNYKYDTLNPKTCNLETIYNTYVFDNRIIVDGFNMYINKEYSYCIDVDIKTNEISSESIYRNLDDYSGGFDNRLEAYKLDTDNNYYCSYTENITKITLPLTKDYEYTALLPSDEDINEFIVDGEGNLFYTQRLSSVEASARHNTGRITRLFSKDQYDIRRLEDMWVNYNRDIYYLVDSLYIGQFIIKLDFDEEGKAVESLIAEVDFDFHYSISRMKNKPGLTYFYLRGNILKFDYNSRLLTTTVLDDITEGSSANIHFSENYLYIAQETSFFRIDLNTYSVTSILEEGKYEMYEFVVSDDELITFTALNHYTSRKVIGVILPDLTQYIAKDSLNENTVHLLGL